MKRDNGAPRREEARFIDGDVHRDLERNLHALYAEPTGTFDRLSRAAHLRPKHDFKNRDLRALSFSGADLSGFDFTGSDLTGTGLRHALNADHTTIFTDSKLDDDDKRWIEAKLRPRKFPTDAAMFRDLLFSSIKLGRLELVYQPKFSLSSAEVIGFEALSRWNHPEHGHIPPYEFISYAEEAGVADILLSWQLETAVEAQLSMANWGHDIAVSVNLPAQALHDSATLMSCIDAVKRSNCKIGFEFSEYSVIQNPEGALDSLRSLADCGAKLAIDDYGSGLSSLAYLKNMPATELKIDAMFIRNLTSSSRDPLLIRSTIDLAHALDMEVTAEGVETEAALALLRVMGCDAAQGYVLSRPLQLKDVRQVLDAPVAKASWGWLAFSNQVKEEIE